MQLVFTLNLKKIVLYVFETVAFLTDCILYFSLQKSKKEPVYANFTKTR